MFTEVETDGKGMHTSLRLSSCSLLGSVPVWSQFLLLCFVSLRQLLSGEVKEFRKRVTIGQSRLLASKLVEERVQNRLSGSQTQFRLILQQLLNQFDGLGGRARTENLSPGLLTDGREFEFRVAWVHAMDLILGGCSKNFDNLNELIDTRFAGEERLTDKELGYNAAYGPHINGWRVVSGAENELRGTVVA